MLFRSYNIDIMEEAASILAFGAGAISKKVSGGVVKIRRAPAIKDVPKYIGRIEQMIERKRELFGQE